MTLEIDRTDCESMRADRDGIANESGREGFTVRISDLYLHFEDEKDAVDMAKMILQRMGER